ncbi:MAG: hypothetical protein IKU21_05545 [Anaerotignum sp.]|nr:hypothetical protein [Anaerotignum sp.]
MRTHSKTPLFLMELIIMLLVFSVSAAICLQVFAGARRISDESRRLDIAVMQAQTAAECWKASYGDLEKTAEYMGTEADENGFSLYDDKEKMTLDFQCEDMQATIIVLNGEEEIFSLKCEAVMNNG